MVTRLPKVARQLVAEAPVGLALATSPQPSGSQRKQNEGQRVFSQSVKIPLLRTIIAILG